MDTFHVDSIVCPRCHANLPASAATCPTCGATTAQPPIAQPPTASAATRDATTSPHPPAARLRLQDRPWFVLVTVFGAALFLGYPILWNCPAFSRSTKMLLSILVAVETVIVFGLFYLAMRWSYLRIVDAW